MKVIICDHCHEKIEKAVVLFNGLRIMIDGETKHEIEEHEFCSIYCMSQYIYSGMKGRGLDDHIKV